jgi:hypothetical protein
MMGMLTGKAAGSLASERRCSILELSRRRRTTPTSATSVAATS